MNEKTLKWLGCAGAVLAQDLKKREKTYFSGIALGFLVKLVHDLSLAPFEGGLKEMAAAYEVSESLPSIITSPLVHAGLLLREGPIRRRGTYRLGYPESCPAGISDGEALWLGRVIEDAYRSYPDAVQGTGASIVPVALALLDLGEAGVDDAASRAGLHTEEVRGALDFLAERGLAKRGGETYSPLAG